MRKKYGQNFLVNRSAREKLITALDPNPGETVWEIGPGLGAMTSVLLDAGAMLTAFEIDDGFIRLLRGFFGYKPNFKLIEGDVLKMWKTQAGEKNLLLGNLPYNIAARLLGDLIEGQRLFRRCVLTVQKEIGERILASAGSKDYSSFTVLVRSVYTARKLLLLKGSSFYPSPLIDSMALILTLNSERLIYPALFYPMVRQLFAGRRKTIKNNLQRYLGTEALSFTVPPDPLTILEKAGVPTDERPENIDIAGFLRLATVLTDMLPKG
ncbi:ribosomal RNA small subunit methyltransferase A [Spirochaetia bacterium]|nr:ribosomal RNA small subunit methyltransferase A [Spirochaetia bacterium]